MSELERYSRNLGTLLKKETVSGYGAQELTKFYEFQALLPGVFPALFAVCEKEDFHGSMLLRWKGKGSGLPLLFMNHHDVVPPEGNWAHPPFSGEVFDGKVFGRGALDTKGGLWAMLQAADDLAAEGFVPDADIYFMSSCNEETDWAGSKEITAALKERGIRFSFVLDEGGMILYEPISGAKGSFAMIGMGERGVAELRFTAKGSGGHASAPDYDSPLVRLGKFMAKADRTAAFRPELSPVIEEMLRRLAPTVSGPLRFVFAHPVLFGPLLRLVMPRLSGTSKALLQSTIAFTMAKGSEGRGILPTEATVIASMRCSHHQGYRASLEAITKLAAKYGISVEVLDPAHDSSLSSFETETFALFERAVVSAFPDVKPCPYIMTGASDACFLSQLTDNCYRFVPFRIDEQQLESIHGCNESVDLSTLEPAVSFYKYLMKGE